MAGSFSELIEQNKCSRIQHKWGDGKYGGKHSLHRRKYVKDEPNPHWSPKTRAKELLWRLYPRTDEWQWSIHSRAPVNLKQES